MAKKRPCYLLRSSFCDDLPPPHLQQQPDELLVPLVDWARAPGWQKCLHWNQGASSQNTRCASSWFAVATKPWYVMIPARLNATRSSAESGEARRARFESERARQPVVLCSSPSKPLLP